MDANKHTEVFECPMSGQPLEACDSVPAQRMNVISLTRADMLRSFDLLPILSPNQLEVGLAKDPESFMSEGSRFWGFP